MTISQAMSMLIKRRAKCKRYKQNHWPEFVTYMRGYMARYRATAKGNAVCRRAQKRWCKKNRQYLAMYNQFNRLKAKG
jgi:hypothetical protein